MIRLASQQHGVLTRAQLLEAGLSVRQVESRLKTGRLRRLHRGVYLLGHLRGPLEPERAFVMAAVLACGPGAAASHRAGAWLLDLAPRPDRGAPVDITVPPGRTPSRRPGIRAHRSTTFGPADRAIVDGIPVTSPLRTLSDLAHVVEPWELEQAIARAQRAGLVRSEDLERQIVRRRGRPGVPRLRAIIEREGGAALTRSAAERRFLSLVRGSGLPAPEVNVVVHGYEVDFFWRREGLAAEVDGFAYHGLRGPFRHDRRRDADLLAAGIPVMRVTWEDLTQEPKKTLVRLSQALALATTEFPEGSA